MKGVHCNDWEQKGNRMCNSIRFNSIELNWIQLKPNSKCFVISVERLSLFNFRILISFAFSLCVYFNLIIFHAPKCVYIFLHFSSWHTLGNCMNRPNFERFFYIHTCQKSFFVQILASMKYHLAEITFNLSKCKWYLITNNYSSCVNFLSLFNLQRKLRVIFPNWMLLKNIVFFLYSFSARPMMCIWYILPSHIFQF